MDNTSNDSNSSLTCIETSDSDRNKALLGIRVALSFVACLFLISMISLMILLKKYVVFTQKMILLLAVTALCFEISAILNVSAFDAYKNSNSLNYCYLMGFIEQLMIWWIIMSYTCIVVDIFLKALFEIFNEKLIILYFVLIFLSPLLHSWIPFVHLSFGPAGAFCWIRSFDLNDCTLFEIGFWLRLALYYIPLYILMAVLVILMTIALLFIKRKRKKTLGTKDEKRVLKMMEKEIRPLIYYPFILIVINIFPLIRRIYEQYSSTDNVYYVLSILALIVYRFQGILITVVFVMDPETRKKLNYTEITAAFRRCCQKEGSVVQEYPMEKVHSDSRVTA